MTAPHVTGTTTALRRYRLLFLLSMRSDGHCQRQREGEDPKANRLRERGLADACSLSPLFHFDGGKSHGYTKLVRFISDCRCDCIRGRDHTDRYRIDHRYHHVGEESETLGERHSASPWAQSFTTQSAVSSTLSTLPQSLTLQNTPQTCVG